MVLIFIMKVVIVCVRHLIINVGGSNLIQSLCLVTHLKLTYFVPFCNEMSYFVIDILIFDVKGTLKMSCPVSAVNITSLLLFRFYAENLISLNLKCWNFFPVELLLCNLSSLKDAHFSKGSDGHQNNELAWQAIETLGGIYKHSIDHQLIILSECFFFLCQVSLGRGKSWVLFITWLIWRCSHRFPIILTAVWCAFCRNHLI